MPALQISSEENRIILALVSPGNYRNDSVHLLQDIQEAGFQVIFVAIHQPCASLREYYTRQGIDVSRIFFIDAITKYAVGSLPAPDDHIRYVNKPGDHTALGIAVTETFRQLGSERVVIYIDSINAMLIYSDSVNLSRFIHFITSKLRILNVAGIFIAVEKGLDPILISQIRAFSDEMIDISESTPTG
jgi:KaiC/GvpD/RAD55 family RecA-like ATPase